MTNRSPPVYFPNVTYRVLGAQVRRASRSDP